MILSLLRMKIVMLIIGVVLNQTAYAVYLDQTYADLQIARLTETDCVGLLDRELSWLGIEDSEERTGLILRLLDPESAENWAEEIQNAEEVKPVDAIVSAHVLNNVQSISASEEGAEGRVRSIRMMAFDLDRDPNDREQMFEGNLENLLTRELPYYQGYPDDMIQVLIRGYTRDLSVAELTSLQASVEDLVSRIERGQGGVEQYLQLEVYLAQSGSAWPLERLWDSGLWLRGLLAMRCSFNIRGAGEVTDFWIERAEGARAVLEPGEEQLIFNDMIIKYLEEHRDDSSVQAFVERLTASPGAFFSELPLLVLILGQSPYDEGVIPMGRLRTLQNVEEWASELESSAIAAREQLLENATRGN